MNPSILCCSAVKAVALSLVHPDMATKALVLEQLGTICRMKEGHEIVLGAFDHFKLEMGEAHRFETLMSYIRECTDMANRDSQQVQFMVACIQFINNIVNSVEDMNFR